MDELSATERAEMESDFKSDGELAPFDSTKLPKDMQREARQEWHYMLYLSGHKYREIEVITGYERTTIWLDIKRVLTLLGNTPTDMESIRQMALMSLRLKSAEIMAAARKAQVSSGPGRAVAWGSVAKLYDVAVGIDTMILQRYTQPGAQGSAHPDIEKAKIIIDFMVGKYGVESLDDFDEYYRRSLSLKKAKTIDVTP